MTTMTTAELGQASHIWLIYGGVGKRFWQSDTFALLRVLRGCTDARLFRDVSPEIGSINFLMRIQHSMQTLSAFVPLRVLRGWDRVYHFRDASSEIVSFDQFRLLGYD